MSAVRQLDAPKLKILAPDEEPTILKFEDRYFEPLAELSTLRAEAARRQGFEVAWESRLAHPNLSWEEAYERWQNGSTS